jgi:hypothetical protein
MTAKLIERLDLKKCWDDVQAAIAELPERRVRGRKPRAK